MTTNHKNFVRLISADGYYCDYCDKYHAEPLHRMTVEFIGKPEEGKVNILQDDLLCPSCKEEDLADFNYMEWTPLNAYLRDNPMEVTYIYPIYSDPAQTSPDRFEKTTDPNVVEKVADQWYIEVEEVYYSEETDEIFVRVDIF